MGLLEPGITCWRSEHADRVAFLVDTQAYFTALRLALSRARHSILLLGWSFDPRTRLSPDGLDAETEPDSVGRMLINLGEQRPDLDIRVLAWKSALPVAMSQEFFPHKAQAWFLRTRVNFRLDDAVPFGGCHHQKVVVVDDAVAFCGGGDISIDRWDTTAHLDADSRRLDPDHGYHAPRHEVVMMVDAAAARALGDLARERWRRATGDALPVPPTATEDPWPQPVRPDLTEVSVSVVRTEPAWAGRKAVHEWRALTLRSIEAARKVIYLENQYFTSPVIAEALAKRLAEPDGPEIILISTRASPNSFDRITMDRTRAMLLRRLREGDVFGRFRAFFPSTSNGRPVVVHAKVTVVDDQLVRIGSANLNNRSGGVDTECELAIEAHDEASAAVIVRLRNFLAGHYVGRSAADVAHAIERQGGLIAAMEALNHHDRLLPIAPAPLTRLTRLIAGYHLGDACDTGDLWRPLARRRLLDEQVQAVAAGLEPYALSAKSITSGR
jgi:phosphatidylserine/phosphatidylglycerophosphate/cardiolipin synthase-like enzyme